jgi:hypothetical protein
MQLKVDPSKNEWSLPNVPSGSTYRANCFHICWLPCRAQAGTFRILLPF